MTVEKNDVYQAFWWLDHQRIFFFAAFLIGSISILSLKLIGAHGGLVSFVAVAIMFAYAFLGTRNKIKVRLDVLGDNLYYLGFLYTLISLSFSLYQLGKGYADINALLENFGLAIMTTLTGLALRVFFNQPKADITEYENTVRMSLTEATASFIGETSKIGRDISTLRAVLTQIVDETRQTQQQATASLNKAIEKQIGLLDKTSAKNQENINALLDKVKITQDDFALNFKANSESMSRVISESMGHISEGANGFINRFTIMDNSMDELKKTMDSLDNILRAFDSIVDKVVKNNEILSAQQITSSETLIKAQQHLIDSSAKISNTFNTLVRDLEISTNESKNKISENIIIFEDRFKSISLAANILIGEIETIAEKMKGISLLEPKNEPLNNSIENSNV
jgi:hypothetical protein